MGLVWTLTLCCVTRQEQQPLWSSPTVGCRVAYLRHLGCGVALCTQEDHGQSRGDAHGRDEHVVVRVVLTEFLEEAEGKVAIGFRNGVHSAVSGTKQGGPSAQPGTQPELTGLERYSWFASLCSGAFKPERNLLGFSAHKQYLQTLTSFSSQPKNLQKPPSPAAGSSTQTDGWTHRTQLGAVSSRDTLTLPASALFHFQFSCSSGNTDLGAEAQSMDWAGERLEWPVEWPGRKASRETRQGEQEQPGLRRVDQSGATCSSVSSQLDPRATLSQPHMSLGFRSSLSLKPKRALSLNKQQELHTHSHTQTTQHRS